MRVTEPQLRTVLLAQAIEHADAEHALVSAVELQEATRQAVAAARARGVARVGVAEVMLDRATTGIGVMMDEPTTKHSGKLDRLRFDLEQRDRPTLVVAHYQASVEAAAAVARETGRRAVTVHGGISRSVRGKAVQDFKDGKVDVLVGSLETIAEGLTLTQADMVIFLEQSYKPSRNQQALRRIHRLGQTRPCVALNYVCVTERGNPTIDGGKRTLLQTKTDLQMRTLTAAQLLAVS